MYIFKYFTLKTFFFNLEKNIQMPSSYTDSGIVVASTEAFMKNFKNLVGYHNLVTEENLPLLGANENLESQSGNVLVVFIFLKAGRKRGMVSLFPYDEVPILKPLTPQVNSFRNEFIVLVYTKSHLLYSKYKLFLWTAYYKVGIFSLRYKIYWLLLSAKGLYFFKRTLKVGI